MKASLNLLMILRSWWLACCLILLGAINSYATHLRAGNIIVEKVGGDCSNRTYRITIIVYTNTIETNVLFGGDQDWLDFGDKTDRVLVPEQSNIVVDSQRGIATASYSIVHTYAAGGAYIISYIEPNRNAGVLNMDNSVNTTFYLETSIRIDPYLGCSTPAQLLVPPIDFACSGVAWTHNPGAYDADHDSISYEFVVPKRDRLQTVANYRDPNNPGFYTNYETGNEDGSGRPTFTIDTDGTIKWDAPGAVGEYNIAFNIVEWRQIEKGGPWYRMGHIRRDMQIIVEDCDNNRPDLEIPPDTCVVAGTLLKETIFGFDLPTDPPKPTLDQVRIQAFSDIFKNPPTAPALAIVTPPYPGVFMPSVPKAKLDFEWSTNCNHVRSQPYQVVFKVSDKQGDKVGLATYKTWLIKVVAPEPKWNSATLNPGLRKATLTWDSYFCSNAEKMQVWRRVDSVSFAPDNCQTGMPDYLGYEKIDEVPINGNGLNQYVDNNNGKGLAPGALYCYRLVAIFPLPDGSESKVSKDICVGPILADVPIITHVTVEKTNTTTGQIRVSWRKPFEAGVIQFPPPYRYKVYRAIGFVRGNDSTLVSPILNGDTTFLDSGINTEENVYNYSIAAYSSNPDPDNFIGASEAASSVRLETKSQVKRIELNWSAIVPWSNLVQSTPTKNYTHVIYRGPEGSTEIDLVAIDSVDATTEGLTYIDKGQFNGEPLEDTKTYCYRIKTRGSYGNPKINGPLLDIPQENFSQMVCVQPGDSIPPLCKLQLSVQLLDCEAYYLSAGTCTAAGLTNTLFWSRPDDPLCRADIRSYNIYRSNVAGGDEFTLIATNITDTLYEDKNLPSFAWCYKISAVDRSGNESELSDEACNDNCPYYELPNVFTPNNDGINDLFSAYSNRYCKEDQICSPKCARFVKKVKFKVFNRWGQEVYTYQSGGDGSEKSIYIDWDGRDKRGSELASAVYFYVAEVTFDVLRPRDRIKTFKGWIHLLDDNK